MTPADHDPPDTDAQAARPPGRPRDPTIDAAVAAAVIGMIEAGVPANEITMLQIAQAAGISRTSLYRRYERVEDVLAAALDSVRQPLEAVDTGNLRDDLVALYGTASDAVERSPLARKLTIVRIGLGLHDPQFRAMTWERHVRPRRAPIVQAVRRAIARGEVPGDTDPEVVVDVINGAGYYQLVVRPDDGGGPARLHAAIEMLVEGLVTRVADDGSKVARHGV